MSVPATRSLAAVLRRTTTAGEGARLIVCVGGPPLPTGAYANLLIAGESVHVPRLSHVGAPLEGEVAYVLATPNFLLYLGTVQTA